MHGYSSKTLGRFLGILLFVGSLAAVIGGVVLAATNGLGMPPSYLDDSIFTSFLAPGILLSGVVGGSQVVAFISVFKHYDWRNIAAAVAGFGMVIWIFAESYIIPETSLLQVVFFVLGIAELITVIALLYLQGSHKTRNSVM